VIAPVSGSPELRLQTIADAITRNTVQLSTLDGTYVNASGDTMEGMLVLYADPTADMDAATKGYVDQAIASYSTFQGNWQVAANIPNITAGGTINAENYLCETANPATPEVAPAGIPGIGGLTISNGDRIIWVTASAVWTLTRSSALTQAEGDAFYVDVAGDTMTGFLTLSADPTAALHAATKEYVDAHGVITWNNRAGNVTLTTADVTAVADSTYVNVPGDTMTGFLTLNADPTANLHAVTKQYADNTFITPAAGDARWVNVTGDTMTGFLTLNADPTAALMAATRQYVDAQIATLLSYINELGQRQNNAAAAQPADPAATGSAVNVMMGFGITLAVAQRTTRAMLFASGEIASSANNGQSWCSLWWGTGTAPAYGAAVPGGSTRVGGEIHFDASSNQQVTSFAIDGLALGLTPSSTIWIDMAVRAQGGNASISQVEMLGAGLIDQMSFP
jgi:hypothetical protein